MTKKEKTKKVTECTKKLNSGEPLTFTNGEKNYITAEKVEGGVLVCSQYLFTEDEESVKGVVEYILNSINYGEY